MPERNTDEKEKLPQRYPFIAIVGPVGIGKTTFTELVTGGADITKLQEPYLENPYLNDFYTKNPADYSFDSQMFFLVNDALQTIRISGLSKGGSLFKDAGKDMNSIIETVQWKMGWISNEDHETYKSTANNAYRNCLRPDIYIALKAKKNTVIERIINRKREMELIFMQKHPEYFPALVWEFDIWLEKKLRDLNSRVVVIDTDKFDFASGGEETETAVKEAINQISYYISAPTQRNMIGSDGAKLIIPGSFRIAPHIVDRVPGAKIYY